MIEDLKVFPLMQYEAEIGEKWVNSRKATVDFPGQKCYNDCTFC